MLLQITKEQIIEELQTSDFDPQELYLLWQQTQKYTKKSKKQAKQVAKTKSERNHGLLEAQEMFLNHLSNINPHPLAKFIGGIDSLEGEKILQSINTSKQTQKNLQNQKDQILANLF
jgi:hypothetical protein